MQIKYWSEAATNEIVYEVRVGKCDLEGIDHVLLGMITKDLTFKRLNIGILL